MDDVNVPCKEPVRHLEPMNVGSPIQTRVCVCAHTNTQPTPFQHLLNPDTILHATNLTIHLHYLLDILIAFKGELKKGTRRRFNLDIVVP